MDDETTTMRLVRVSGGTRRRRRMRRADPDVRVLRRCRTLMLAITPMWWIMWGVFLASATMPATMRAGIGLIVLAAGLLAPAPHHPIHAGNGKEARTAGVEGVEPDMKGTYRIIDRRRRHGLIRLYLAGRPDPGYTGDDWDDSPYERNAGPVCQDFVDATPTLAVPWGLAAVEPRWTVGLIPGHVHCHVGHHRVHVQKPQIAEPERRQPA